MTTTPTPTPTPTPTRTPTTLRLPARRRPAPTRTRLHTRRLPVAAYVVAMLVLPVAAVLGAQATGWWITAGHTVPATALGAEALGVAAENGTGNADGLTTTTVTSPHDVKGSMSVQQILDAFPPITAAEVYQLFGASADTPTSTQLKTLAQNGNGYEVSDLREWLETRQGTAG